MYSRSQRNYGYAAYGVIARCLHNELPEYTYLGRLVCTMYEDFLQDVHIHKFEHRRLGERRSCPGVVNQGQGFSRKRQVLDSKFPSEEIDERMVQRYEQVLSLFIVPYRIGSQSSIRSAIGCTQDRNDVEDHVHHPNPCAVQSLSSFRLDTSILTLDILTLSTTCTLESPTVVLAFRISGWLLSFEIPTHYTACATSCLFRLSVSSAERTGLSLNRPQASSDNIQRSKSLSLQSRGPDTWIHSDRRHGCAYIGRALYPGCDWLKDDRSSAGQPPCSAVAVRQTQERSTDIFLHEYKCTQLTRPGCWHYL